MTSIGILSELHSHERCGGNIALYLKLFGSFCVLFTYESSGSLGITEFCGLSSTSNILKEYSVSETESAFSIRRKV
jgi:hypothetical protein